MNTQSIINFLEIQKRTFEELILDRDKDDFFRGTIAGLDLALEYCNKMAKWDKIDKGDVV